MIGNRKKSSAPRTFTLTLVLVSAPSAGMADTKKEFERLLTEDAFVSEVVGKTLIYQSGAVVIFKSDRTFGGTFSGSPVWGEWDWREDRICHQMNIGEKRYKVTCKVPQLGQRRIRFIREDGSFYGIAKLR